MKTLISHFFFVFIILLSFYSQLFAKDPVDIRFSHSSGYYESVFDLQINTETVGTSVVYTLDGSNPQHSSTVLVGNSPITLSIDPTSTLHRSKTPAVILRASLKQGDTISYSLSRTFIFMDKVKSQSYPGAPWSDAPINSQVFNYNMDGDVVNNTSYKDLIDDALLDLPTLSILIDNDSLFDSTAGIYVNAAYSGIEWERACGVELLNHNGVEGFNINAGLRMRGGQSRQGRFPKHSMRLFFRDEYGAKKLQYPLFGEDELSSFAKIDLSSSQSFSWSRDASVNCTFLRDVFARVSQGEAGQAYTRSNYYHLFLNGMYWGLYQTQERAESQFAEDYFGGDKDDYDIIKIAGMKEDGSGTVKELEASDGTMDKWGEVFDLCDQGFSRDEDYYHLEGKGAQGDAIKDAEVLVDIDNLIDYTLNIFYTGNYDASPSQWTGNRKSNNIIIIGNRENKSQGFKFIVHDSEFSLFTGLSDKDNDRGTGLYENRVDIGDRGPWYSMMADGLSRFHSQWLHFKLTDNEEYRFRFADRAYAQLTDDGIFTPQRNIERLNKKAKEMEMAIIAESARWGDGADDSYTLRTKDNAWLPALDTFRLNYFPYRTQIVIDQLKEYDLFPALDAPLIRDANFNKVGEVVKLEAPVEVCFTNPTCSGVMYYTIDGSDPRMIGGTISSKAIAISEGVKINISSSMALKARIKDGGVWGALASSLFLADQTDYSSFKVTELHYHPVDEVVNVDTLGAKKYEFIEFRNTSSSDYLNMTGVSIDSGIRYEFPDNYLLAPQAYFVVASKPRYFYERYGVAATGNFSKNLSNSSERIVVNNSKGEAIIDFVYSDDLPWPEYADGKGPSLCSIEKDPIGDPNTSAYWRHSNVMNGTPFGNDNTTSSMDKLVADHFVVNVFPIPTSSYVNIEVLEYHNGENRVELYDINGTLLLRKLFVQHTQINLHSFELSSGIYFLKIFNGEQLVIKKVVYTL